MIRDCIDGVLFVIAASALIWWMGTLSAIQW